MWPVGREVSQEIARERCYTPTPIPHFIMGSNFKSGFLRAHYCTVLASRKLNELSDKLDKFGIKVPKLEGARPEFICAQNICLHYV